jgi:general secretion pathway protein B
LPSRDDSRVFAFNDLAPELRSQLPALSIGGSSYSENPASRLLIVNGQVFREGDRLHPDLVLERIDLKSAVLRFKDIRYQVSF